MIKQTLLILSLTLLCSKAIAIEKCYDNFRPNFDEVAVAAIGAPLVVKDTICKNDYLVIPYEQKINAVKLQKGEYRAIEEDNNRIYFRTSAEDGAEIKTCYLCDGLKNISIDKQKQDTLCVTSVLNVNSCAIDKKASFFILKNKEHITENQCTNSLSYQGRSESTLYFAYKECNNKEPIYLRYDLNYGKIIVFLNQRFEIIKANNEGLVYKRLKEADLTIKASL